jgi:hypothetical protein
MNNIICGFVVVTPFKAYQAIMECNTNLLYRNKKQVKELNVL